MRGKLRGGLGWLGGNFSLPEKGIAIEGILVDIPVWYRTGVAKPPVKTLSGKLEVESITLPLLPKQQLSILLDTGPNRISVESPTVIQVPGGDLVWDPFRSKNSLVRILLSRPVWNLTK